MTSKWRRNDVDATSLRRIDVVTTSCACWEFAPPAPQNSKPWPPQYSKPSYAYGMQGYFFNLCILVESTFKGMTGVSEWTRV